MMQCVKVSTYTGLQVYEKQNEKVYKSSRGDLKTRGGITAF